MKIIGVTGPSGSGKSVLTEYFAKCGIPTIDADALYHSMLIPPSPCLDAIRSNFGDGVFSSDGTLDRGALGAVVFNDEKKLKLLNSTVLGLVLDRIREIIADLCARGETAVIVDAPTLIESGFYRECGTVVSVIAPAKDRIVRICERDGITEEKARQRVEAQKKDEFYISHSHITVYNNGAIEEYLDRIRSVAAELGFDLT